MREIKFRAWNGKEIIEPQTASNSVEFFMGQNSDGLEYSEYMGKGVYKKHPLMQYTGLKDKNGKEIYEGDIVIAYSEGQKGTFEVKWRQEASPCYILYPAWQHRMAWHISATEYYKGKQFIGVDGKIETTEKEGYYDDGLEVIGNIYENKELLN